ncbi:MAG: sterol desaturase family protein [Pseudomonadota bacterium]
MIEAFAGIGPHFPAEFASAYGKLTAIIWARYFLISGLFFAGLWLRPEHKVRGVKLARQRPDRAIMVHEIRMSLLSSLIYAFPGAIVMLAWRNSGTAIYSDVSAIGGPIWGWVYLPISVFIYLAIHDTYFYWTHRAMHHRLLFKPTHLTHHRSHQPTPWAAFSFHPWEAFISSWAIPIAAFFIPLHTGALMALLVIMTYCGVANHSGWEIIPRSFLNGPIGRWLITASHHNVHHTKYRSNYGLYFRFWDKVCGTDTGLAAPATARDRGSKTRGKAQTPVAA